MPLQLIAKNIDSLPLNVSAISPATLCGLSRNETERLATRHGNQETQLADHFQISGSLADDQTIEWRGDLTSVHGIGATMASGHMVVHGDAGRHLASGMSGGQLTVHGSAGDYVGSRLEGGLVRIDGNVGDFAGGAYENASFGMRGGELIIAGSTGHHAGYRMRRGLLVIAGDCGAALGANMRAGTIVVHGLVARDVGTGMQRGTIVLSNAPENENLAFQSAYTGDPIAVRILANRLKQIGVPMPDDSLDFQLVNGDLTTLGRGELLIQKKNGQ